jgi:hypothetical protein
MFLLSIWTKEFECLYIEIIHRLEGSGVFSFFFLQNKMALFLSFSFLTRKKNDLNTYEQKQTYTQKTMIYTYDNKKKSEITRGKRRGNTE